MVEGELFCRKCGMKIEHSTDTMNNDNDDYQQQNQYTNDSYYEDMLQVMNQSFVMNTDTDLNMTLFDGFKKCMKEYAKFDGRARRKEYWGFNLFLLLFYVLGLILAAIIDTITAAPFLTSLVDISLLAFIVPSISVAVRRLHDIGKSGAWYFISFIPIIGGIWMLVLMCTEGDFNENMYGPPTKQPLSYQ